MAHVDGVEDFTPRLTLGTEGLPGLVVLLDINGASLHELVDALAVSMANAHSVNEPDALVTILVDIVIAHALDTLRPGALEDVGHAGLGAVAVQVVGQLAGGLVSTEHDRSVCLRKDARVLGRELLTARVHSRTDHNDLRIQAHVVVVAEGHSPVQHATEVIGEGLVNEELHDIGGLLVAVALVQHTVVGKQAVDGEDAITDALLRKLAVAVVLGFTEDGRRTHHLQGLERVQGIGNPAHEVLMAVGGNCVDLVCTGLGNLSAHLGHILRLLYIVFSHQANWYLTKKQPACADCIKT